MPRIFISLFAAVMLAALLCAPAQAQALSLEEAAKMLPDEVGDFRARGAAYRPAKGGVFERAEPQSFDAVSEARRSYVSASGDAVHVTLVGTRSDAAAYSLLTYDARDNQRSCNIGAACVEDDGYVAFSKGPTYVSVSGVGKPGEASAPLDFARALSETLGAGSGSIPVLVLHLPEWEKVIGRTDYAVSLPTLQSVAGGRPALEAVTFDGGAEAATAVYGESRLVIVEFTTPQYAQENDTRINERLRQLREEGRPVPAYRRVGNYAVFVFDAPDEMAAAGLIDGVKYEKDVRWLGDNPRELERMQERYTNTMGGVIVATLKATGLAIILCLGIGGLFGGAVFLYRRAQSTAAEIYSDAGGMLRLNIEDVNAPHSSAKLVGDGEK